MPSLSPPSRRSLYLLAGRVGRWPRRLLALVLLAAAALTAAAHPRAGPAAADDPPRDRVAVLVAARDLSAGRTVGQHDLRTAQLPAAVVPAGALRPGASTMARLTGRSLAGPVRRGETLTDLRFVGTPLAAAVAGAGAVALPVRIADADVAWLLHPGDRIDLLAAPSSDGQDGAGPGETAQSLVTDVPIVAVPAHRGQSVTDGALIVIAVQSAAAARIVGLSATRPLAAILRPP